MFSKSMIFAGLYILGITLASKVDISAMLFIFFFLALLFLARCFLLGKTDVLIAVAAICILSGGIRYFGAAGNRLYYELPDKYVTVSGTVISMPTEASGKYKYRYTVKSESFSYLDKDYITKQRILLNTDKELAYGDKILAKGFLSEVRGTDNSGEYNYPNYYKSIGVYNRIAAREIEKTGEEVSLNPIFLSGKLKCYISEIIKERFSGDKGALLRAITVGDRAGFSREYRDVLKRTGVSRTLYSAYTHIFLILFIARLLFRKDGREDREYAVMVMLVIYAVYSSPTAYILKAAALLGIMIFRKTTLGFADKMEVLAEVVLVMTFIDPMLCFNGGFVISVASTFIVYHSFPVIYKRISGRFMLGRKGIKAKRMLVMWITLLLGTLPLSAYFYNGTAVYGGLLVYILAPVIILILIISPIVLGICSAFGPDFGNVMDWLLEGFSKIPYVIEKLPFCYLTLKSPTVIEIVIFYIIWWIALRIMSNDWKHTKTTVLAAILCGALIGNTLGYDFNTLLIYFVNVGQGDGAVLKTALGDTVLIDGGGSAEYETSYNVGESVYVPYLISHGITSVDVAIVTHSHKDHIEGIIAAAKRLKINTVVMPEADDNEYSLELKEVCRDKNIKIEYLMKDDEIRFKSGLKIKFIAPDTEQKASEDLNDTSLVAEVRYGDFCGIFTGDSTDKIDESYPEDIHILKVAHHGSREGTDEEYLEHLRPKVAVISVGEENSYGLPNREVLDRLETTGATILRTDIMGDIQFKIKKDGKMKYTTLKGGG